MAHITMVWQHQRLLCTKGMQRVVNDRSTASGWNVKTISEILGNYL